MEHFFPKLIICVVIVIMLMLGYRGFLEAMVYYHTWRLRKSQEALEATTAKAELLKVRESEVKERYLALIRTWLDEGWLTTDQIESAVNKFKNKDL